jgi:outer membrane protein
MKRILLAALAFTAIQLTADAQKFGHINAQELLLAMPERATAEAKIQKQAGEFDALLREMQNELQAMTKDFEQKSQTWGDAIRNTKYTAIMNKQREMEEFAMNAQEELQKEEAVLLKPMLDKAQAAINEVGKENGFTYIFDTSTGAVVYDGGENVMPLVKAKLGIK